MADEPQPETSQPTAGGGPVRTLAHVFAGLGIAVALIFMAWNVGAGAPFLLFLALPAAAVICGVAGLVALAAGRGGLAFGLFLGALAAAYFVLTIFGRGRGHY
jgi:hypothetical protein